MSKVFLLKGSNWSRHAWEFKSVSRRSFIVCYNSAYAGFRLVRRINE